MSKRGLGGLPLSLAGLFVIACADGKAGATEVDETGDDPSGDGDGDGDGDGGGDGDGLDEFPPCGERPPGGGVPGPPTLIAAELVDDLVVQLSFSEPIASVDDVDPSAFRISFAYTYAYEGDAVTYYVDPMLWLCGHTDGCFGDYTDVVELGCVDDDPNALRLRLDIFRGDIICPLIEFQAEYGLEILMLPHFDAEIGAITDLEGEPLESLGVAWVGAEGLGIVVDGEFPDYPNPVAIPCAG